jgi:hypothetical protein
VDFDGKVRATQFALHALDAILRTCHLHQERIHLENVLGAELDADTASLAIPFNDFDSRTAHFPLVSFCWFTVR